MTFEPKPPRRDPRILALVPSEDAIAYATVDAWEVTGTGALETGDPRGFRLSIRRLIVQTRPTVIVCAAPKRRPALSKLMKLAAIVAARSGIPLVSLAGDLARELLDGAPELESLKAQYPELRVLGVAHGEDAIRLAASALSSLPLPSRSYATRSSRSGPSVAAGTPPGPRPIRRALTAAACGAHGTRPQPARPGDRRSPGARPRGHARR